MIVPSSPPNREAPGGGTPYRGAIAVGIVMRKECGESLSCGTMETNEMLSIHRSVNCLASGRSHVLDGDPLLWSNITK